MFRPRAKKTPNPSSCPRGRASGLPKLGFAAALALLCTACIPPQHARLQLPVPAAASQPPPAVFDVRDAAALDALVARIGKKRAIFIGEIHDVVSHHQNQLAVIKALYARNPELAIGVEFIQQPFQSVLDDYVAGNIDERELLYKTEYYERWRVDYRMLRPIFEFAREKQIPLVALNVSSEIHNKVYARGLHELSLDERDKLPENIHPPGDDYRQRLQVIFDAHPEGNSFANFVDGQVLWDEYMAETAANYLRNHPDSRMVILAGLGHVLYRDGIPKALDRRLDEQQSSVLINGDQFGDYPGIADYLLTASDVEALPPPGRLGVLLEDKADGVFINGFSADSAAREGGIEIGDQIVALGASTVANMAEIKTVLFDKQPGEHMQVSIRRTGEDRQENLFLIELLLR